MNTLNKWLTKIELLHPETIEMGLERIASVAHDLKLTSFNCPVITVGGTNGKGSCVKFLESMLQSEGYQVGTYTSPHLLHFNERIQVNGETTADDFLCAAFETVEHARKKIPLTFFEFTTLAALWIFKQKNLDALVLEVGMGGRLDAVNIVDADVAIVSSVDIDHTEWLGSTRESIGYEKAGIFRPNKIAICGDACPPTSLLQHANQIGSELYCLGRDFIYKVDNNEWTWQSAKIEIPKLPIPNLPLMNAATSLMAITKMQSKLKVTLQGIRQGIEAAFIPGRFEIINNNLILDVAHNPAAAKMLAHNLQKLNNKKKLLAVVGMLRDKDVKATLKELIPYVDIWYLGSLNVKRGASSDFLASQLQDIEGLQCYTYKSISEAFSAATYNLNADDKIVVFGSFYSVAEILQLVRYKP